MFHIHETFVNQVFLNLLLNLLPSWRRKEKKCAKRKGCYWFCYDKSKEKKLCCCLNKMAHICGWNVVKLELFEGSIGYQVIKEVVFLELTAAVNIQYKCTVVQRFSRLKPHSKKKLHAPKYRFLAIIGCFNESFSKCSLTERIKADRK